MQTLACWSFTLRSRLHSVSAKLTPQLKKQLADKRRLESLPSRTAHPYLTKLMTSEGGGGGLSGPWMPWFRLILSGDDFLSLWQPACFMAAAGRGRGQALEVSFPPHL